MFSVTLPCFLLKEGGDEGANFCPRDTSRSVIWPDDKQFSAEWRFLLFGRSRKIDYYSTLYLRINYFVLNRVTDINDI